MACDSWILITHCCYFQSVQKSWRRVQFVLNTISEQNRNNCETCSDFFWSDFNSDQNSDQKFSEQLWKDLNTFLFRIPEHSSEHFFLCNCERPVFRILFRKPIGTKIGAIVIAPLIGQSVCPPPIPFRIPRFAICMIHSLTHLAPKLAIFK